MGDFLIGRQLVVARDLSVYAYELLFRDQQGLGAEAFGPTAASNQVIVDSLLEQGLERVVGEHRAFINFTRDNILSGTAALLPKDQVIIEVLESVDIDDVLIETVSNLAKSGYTIALDDFVFAPKWLPLLDVAHIVKFDLMTSSAAQCREVMAKLAPRRLLFLAEKVETAEQFREFADLGCELFQGFYFSRPNIVRGKRLETNQAALLQLLAKINEPDITIANLVKTLSLDVGLSYRLLRYINSASFGLQRKVDSLAQAVNLLGLREIRRWASLILLASFPDKPKETLNVALIRAQMCMAMADLARCRNADQFFLVGLMSTIDQLLDCPLADVVPGLPLSETVKNALLHRSGEPGAALSCAMAYECWSLEQARFANLPIGEIGRIYLESVAWAYGVSNLSNDR